MFGAGVALMRHSGYRLDEQFQSVSISNSRTSGCMGAHIKSGALACR